MTDLRGLLRNGPTLHYYGDIVRALFIGAGLIMLVTLPFLGDLVPVPYFVSIILIVAIVVFAGLTNPKQKWINYVNSFISVIAFAVFEYYSIKAYSVAGGTLFLVVNQILAIIFFIALYYSIKSMRGKIENSDK